MSDTSSEHRKAKGKSIASSASGVSGSAKKQAGAVRASDYVHLHNHTQYSLLDGLTRIPDLVNFVKDSGMAAVAKTDHGTLSGTIEFYKSAKDSGVKPIIGMETYVAMRTHLDKDPQKDKARYHLILLAMNDVGYHNLMRLSSIANLDGFYYHPRVDHDLLEKHNEGLIVLSGCMSGEVGDALKNDQYDQAVEVAKWYKKVFGDRYYLEIQDHGHPDNPLHSPEQLVINQQVLKLGQELDIPVVVTCDAHYLKHEDQDAHEILLCVGTGSFLSDEKRMSLKDFPLHVEDPAAIVKRWGKEHPDVITNTRVIADRCDVNIELGKILIPKFPVPKGEDEKSHLHKLVWQGLAWRYGGVGLDRRDTISVDEAKKSLSKDIIERAEYELGVMDQMGYNGYFLIVQDFINWGKDQGIIFGPGRGSAAGSIVSYAIRITEIDPMKYTLMFERFLNPGRISMPDIDIDIQDTRRDEVIQYCVGKYGAERVANIVTFGRMFARNAVRDVSRVLQVSYAEADRLAKMIPAPVQGRHIPLAESLKKDPELKKEYESNEVSKQVLDQALILEGTVRSHGIHAAGVVIAPDDIVKFAPLEMAQKGVVSTQYPMGPVEELGLLKMDFLGLSNLTILKNALRIIRKVYKKNIELSDIPNDDAKTFELFRRGDTTGVFQFESAGMKRYLRELGPTEFSDLVAMNALYRPGPLAEIPKFIKGKNDASSIQYLHESLEPILSETYGVMVYQEQIIKLLQLVAGYTPGEADLVRKAIGKKKRDIMNAEEPKFVAGCVKQGLTEAGAKQLWAQIQPFADYSFNKAHATCYSQIAYWTAYLKAHYPASFMAALMTSDYDDTDRLAIEIAECTHMGIAVLAPDVNESFLEFAVVPATGAGPDAAGSDAPQGAAEQRTEPYTEYGKGVAQAATQRGAESAGSADSSAGGQAGVASGVRVRFGMKAIKNVGTGAVEEILRARKEVGHFDTLEDFLASVSPNLVNRKTMESLIKAGAFDNLGDRSKLLHNLDLIMAYSARLHKQAGSGQTDLFGELTDNEHLRARLELAEPTIVHNIRERLTWERELLGLFLSQHPLDSFAEYLAEQTVPLDYLKPEHDGKTVYIGGSIVESREILTKKGQKMAFVRIEDKNGSIEAVLFPGAYQKTLGLWQPDTVVLITGKLSAKGRDGEMEDEVKILVDDAREITLEQAENYQATGKKAKLPKTNTAAVAKAAREAGKSKRVYVRLPGSDDQALLMKLKAAIDARAGQDEVVLVMGADKAKQIIRLPGGIKSDPAALGELRELVGADNVKFQ